jgi:hypothetical protein
MSLQNTYLTIWKATVYYMIFNMASDILDPVKLNYCPLFKNLALCGLMLLSSFWMPGVVMVSGGITGCGLTPLLGMLSIDSVVNTDLNCSFKMLAFCLVSTGSHR